MMQQVKDAPGWIRDERGFLVNTNQAEFAANKRVRQREEMSRSSLAKTQDEVADLRNEIDQINKKMDLILNLLQGGK